MQRNNDNKYPSEDNVFVTKPSSANVLENLNATSSHANQNPTAKAMRSGQEHEFAYEIAGPAVGGMAPQATPYNQYSITDSMSKTKISEGTPNTTTTTTNTKPVGASSTDSISKAGAKAAGAVGAVPAGAAATGGDLVNAARNVVSHHGTPEDSLDSPHPHPITYMSGKTTEVKSQTATTSTPRSAAKPAFVEPIHSTGLNNPVAPTHHHATQNVPKGEVVTAGVIGAASAISAAPPMNDTIKATPRFTPFEPSSHPPSQISSNDGLAKMTANSTPSTATPAQEKHLHEHHSGIKDKVKNVFRRRSSAQAAAEAEAAAAAAAEDAKPKSYDAKLDRFEAIPETPYTSSGAPKADLHAAPGKPAVKLDAHPTTTLNQGHNSRRREASTSDLAMSKTSTTSSSSSVSSRPLSEKITAPVVGAAAAGTAAYMGKMAKDAKDTKGAFVDSTNTSTYSSKSVTPAPHSTPVINTTSTYAPATTLPAVERTTAKTTGTTTDPSRPLTKKVTAPMTGAAATVGAATAGTAAYMSNKAKDTMDAATSGNAHNSSSYKTTTTTGTTPAPTTYSKTTPTTITSSLGTTPVQVKSADKIAIPASYKGPIPKAGPGEEVVWVKTTTTTDYYDTDKGVDTNGDVVETRQNVLDPNSFQTEHNNVTTYVNDGHGGKRPLK
ncbi:hypothetical protein BG006_011096 [Podila minutissima]|uniref:Uncharacterized protein n=1 Tax=Podila minutissima TaxID=64525 RepID=A0A9P5SCA9_9FUNG|nr:hypothetical protein BG006_011096 [Podila minutissima]